MQEVHHLLNTWKTRVAGLVILVTAVAVVGQALKAKGDAQSGRWQAPL